jgi:hypothetical protein
VGSAAPHHLGGSMDNRVQQDLGAEPALHDAHCPLQQYRVRHQLLPLDVRHHGPMRWWGWVIVGVVIGVIITWIILIPVPPSYVCVHNDHHVTCGDKVFP